MLKFQRTGSNTHNNGAPGGDGQTGDDGQGATGTDRNNLVEINDLNENYPIPFEMTTIWKDIDLVGYLNTNLTDDRTNYIFKINPNDFSKDLALYMSSSGYYMCAKSSSCANSYESLTKLDTNLSNAPASLPGVVLRFKSSNKFYYYMCSRNNNFSNRSQKGSLYVA